MAKREVEVDVKSKGTADLARELRDAAKAAKEAVAALRELQSTPAMPESTKAALRAGKTPSSSATSVTKGPVLGPFGITPEEMAQAKEMGRRGRFQDRDALREARAAQQTQDRETRKAEQGQKKAERDQARADRDALFARDPRMRIFTLSERRQMTAMAGPQTGPMQRLAQAHRELSRAEASDDPSRIFDARTAVATAQAAVQNANARLGGGGAATRVNQFLASLRMRLGAGGGAGGGGGGAGMFGSVLISPLIRGAAGIGEAAGISGAVTGPLAAGIIAAIIAAKVFAEELMKATATIRDFTSARTLSGGTTGEIARLTAAGFSPQSIPNIAAQFRERLSRDPFAIYTAASLGGGYRMPRPFGSTNETSDLMNVLDSLRQVKDAETQLRMARMMGLEATLELIRVSDKVWEGMKRDADLREQVTSDDTIQSARDLAGEFQRMQYNMDTLRQTAMQPFIPQLAEDLNTVNEIARSASAWMGASDAGRGATAGVAAGIRDAVLNIFPGLKAVLDASNAASGGTATEENTRAIQDNTRAQVDTAYLLRFGFSTPEASARVRRVLPESMFDNPIGMRKWLEGQTAGSGAYRY